MSIRERDSVDGVTELLKESLSKVCAAGHRKERPLIAIVNSYMDISPGDYHLKKVATHVKEGIIEANGFPVEVPIPGFCGELGRNSTVRKYYFAYRDFASAMVEFLIGFHDFAGAVFMCTCDNQIPAFIMGALRLNLPSVFVTGGYMRPGILGGREITAFSVAKEYACMKEGFRSSDNVVEITNIACPTAGACSEMGTANTMAVLAEASGLTLPGCSSMSAESSEHNDLAKKSGIEVMNCVKKGIRPRDIVNHHSIMNMIQVCLAIGGSTNAVIHVNAIAREVGLQLSLEDWDRLSRDTPVICAISPNQEGFYMPHYEACGGTLAVMKTLRERLHYDCFRVDGKTLAQTLEQVHPKYNEVLRAVDYPFQLDGGLVVLKGNLAPIGGILKKSSLPDTLKRFEGLAKVFDNEEDALRSILRGEIFPRDVVVVRYEGPSAGPGSREVVSILHTLRSKNLHNQVAVITDGRMSGTNLGLAVCNISPEASKGTALSVIQNGDKVVIDIDKRQIELVLKKNILEKRLAEWVPPTPPISSGILALYGKNVSQLSEGARII